MRRLRRILIGLLVLTCSWSTVASAIAAASGGTLGIQDIDASAYPDVAISVTVPPSLGEREPTFRLAENGAPIEDVRVSSSSSGGQSARVVLVMDSSGSMDGGPLADAKLAARRFVDSMNEDASIALVSFDDQPTLVSAFTDDRMRLDGGIASLGARGETSLYDALVRAAELLPEEEGVRRSIVVLSDGGDTVSNASFEKTIDVLKRSGVPVFAVALKSDEYNPRALQVLTKQTGGRLVPAGKSSEFASLFEGIAEEISNVWVLQYRSGRPRTTDIEVDVTATSGDREASVVGSYRNPAITALAASDRPLTLADVRDDPVGLVSAVLLAFLAVTLLAIGLLLIVLRDRPNLRQLAFYDQLHDDAGDPMWSEDDVRSRVVDAVGYVAGKRGFTELAATRLEAAGLPLRPAEYITVHLLLVIGAGVVVMLTTGRTLLSVGVVILATVLPVLLVGSIAERRLRRFQEQLPDVLNMISGSLRAGWGFQQAIGLCVQEAPKPSSDELKRVDTETRLGMPLERALQSMADRMSSDDFRAVVTAVAVQREIGGNLAEVLDIVSKTIRERESVRRQIRSLTAEGRLSAYILVALPFAVFAALLFFNPSYMLPLISTPMGLLLLLVAIVLLVVGSVWVFAVTRIEV